MAARHLDEPRALPRANRRLVPLVRVDGDPRPARREQVLRHRTGGVRTEPAAARARHEEHVEAFRMDLEVPDRLAFGLDDPRIDGAPREALAHLVRREGLPVPVAADLRVGVPCDEPVDIGVGRRPELRQSSSYAKSHITTSERTPPAFAYSPLAASLSGSVRTTPSSMPCSRASAARRSNIAVPMPRRRCDSTTSTSYTRYIERARVSRGSSWTKR